MVVEPYDLAEAAPDDTPLLLGLAQAAWECVSLATDSS
ncbi:hypothetical protein Pcac1_g14205 [Phytophthora cactorum]|uniref:Uncharacterized protein n=1 Tax=Phytophthora cactorum TaxID=29920 RepID=A0A8T1BSR5_9STRA|nr:hypothetical protein Pcac1_g14205 [Phytophthora cactorum]KAG2883928.1 hypothetical protein PC114_g20371 [Phytophthora cactorum]KAG2907761.1 hypothetical protein PC117_g20137 [Phytophthora cactorum]KAG2963170.1 hypothetical protein PC119_g25598 [Phytophthora cactorum]KAG3008556.1 hypothetical protein PC120_g16162 [Phytophthora cactorum]